MCFINRRFEDRKRPSEIGVKPDARHVFWRSSLVFPGSDEDFHMALWVGPRAAPPETVAEGFLQSDPDRSHEGG